MNLQRRIRWISEIRQEIVEETDRWNDFSESHSVDEQLMVGEVYAIRSMREKAWIT